MTVIKEKKVYTPEDYLELEKKVEEKHEYRDGEIVLMAGGTTNHNKLAGKLYARLLLALEDEGYEVYMGVRLWILRYRQYTYPDVMVVQGKLIYQSPGKTTITNPSLIVEVLSQSTQAYDHTDKFRYYRSIPKFKEYVLIDQYSMFVEQFVKMADGKWILTEFESEEGVLRLESVQLEIGLKELYKGVNFEEKDEE